MARHCTGCDRDLPEAEFGKSAYDPSGRQRRCRACMNRKNRETRDKMLIAAGRTPPQRGVAPAPAASPLIEAAAALADAVVESRRALAEGPALRAFEAELATPPVPVPEQLPPVEEHRLRGRVRDLEAERKRLIEQLSDALALGDVAAAAALARREVEPIRPRERASRLREGTALVLASDWHVEEEVRPEQVSGRNRYDLAISRRRMERFFEATRWAVQFNRQAFTIRDMVLWLGGDFLTNYLHDDNIESNLLSPVQTIAYLHENISAGIRHLLADGELARIVIPCNDGNHGRLTDKMRSSSRVANSIEWLLYSGLAREFAGEPRVEFQIASGEHLYLDIYGRTVRFTHGDAVRYGGGVGGITIPIYKALARWDTVRRADLTCMGHFHQLTRLADLIINGSLIGYGPFSLTIGARFEQPAQSFSILEPSRFNSINIPLWVGEREDDEEAA